MLPAKLIPKKSQKLVFLEISLFFFHNDVSWPGIIYCFTPTANLSVMVLYMVLYP